MAKRVKKQDLKDLIEHALRCSFKCPPCYNIKIDSISATIEFTDEAVAKALSSDHIEHCKVTDFVEILENHAGENIIPKIVAKDDSIILQIDYDIVE